MIEVDGVEPPLGDGSAMPFVDALRKAGIVRQDAPKDYLIIDKTIQYSNPEKEVDIVALPLDDFRMTVMVDYKNPALGSQHTGMFNLEQEFVDEFAPARTFCFLTEIEALHDAGLIKGGTIDSAVVIVDRELDEAELIKLQRKLGLDETIHLNDHGFLNDITLRYRNEPEAANKGVYVGMLYIGAAIKNSAFHTDMEKARAAVRKSSRPVRDTPATWNSRR